MTLILRQKKIVMKNNKFDICNKQWERIGDYLHINRIAKTSHLYIIYDHIQ